MKRIHLLLLWTVLYFSPQVHSAPLTCNHEAIVNYVTSGTFSTGTQHIEKFNLADGSLVSDTPVNGLRGVTSLGYNMVDNYLWGFNMANKKIVRIDANNDSITHNVTGLIDELYSGADVNSQGILHLSVNQNVYNHASSTLKIERIDLNTATPTLLAPLRLNTSIDALDVSFNPLDNHLYFIARDGKFYRIRIANGGTTGTVELVGDTGLGSIYNVVAYFDKDGNFYFNTNSTAIYQLKFTASGITSVTNFATLSKGLTQGDGAMCAKAGMAPPPPPPPAPTPFTCQSESFVSFNTEGSPMIGESKFNTISLLDGGVLKSPDILNGVQGVNSVGYNIIDNFVWGYNLASSQLVKIGANHSAELYNISGLDKRFYVAADVNKQGILYLSSRNTASERLKLARVNLTTKTALSEVTLNQEINTADMAFNPIDNHLYFIQTGTDILYKIVFSADGLTGTVTSVGSTGLGAISPIITFFDKDGNFYFNANNNAMYKVDTKASTPTATFFTNLDTNLVNGDGARCANAGMAPPPVLTPFSCTDTFFFSNRSQSGTAATDSGASWLHTINRNDTPYSFESIGSGYSSNNGGYNAIGYNVKDNFIYGLYQKMLVKIDQNGTVLELGEIDGLDGTQYYAGEFDRDGYYYVSGSGGPSNTMYKIDIAQKKVIQIIPLSQNLMVWDFAIDETGDYFYAMNVNYGGADYVNDKVSKIELSTGTVTTIGMAHDSLSSYISLVFSDKTGQIFMLSNDNGFYKVDTTTGALTHLSSTQTLNFYNDGTSCPNAVINTLELSPCAGPDTDKDTVPDSCDLDSDNDGVSDLEEGRNDNITSAAGWNTNVGPTPYSQNGWTENALTGYSQTGYNNNVLANTPPDFVFGSGITKTLYGAGWILSDLENPNLALAIAHDDYAEYTFTTSPNLQPLSYIKDLYTYNYYDDPYKVAVLFSSDNFTSYETLVFNSNMDIVPLGENARGHFHTSTASSLLSPSTTYKLRVYFYGAEKNTTTVQYDDFNFGISSHIDSDNDGIPNYLDLDSDNDGIPDNVEAQATNKYNAPQGTVDKNGTWSSIYGSSGLSPVDTDSDGTPDYLDLDSDNDGFFDINESGLGNNDSNNTGQTNADVGINGIDNSPSHEHNDSYDDINGLAYENGHYLLQDSDEDILKDGSNALAMIRDFNYRDAKFDAMVINVNDFAAYEGNESETEFIIPIKLSKPAPTGGIYINYLPKYLENSNVYQDDFADLSFQEYFEKNPVSPPEVADALASAQASADVAFDIKDLARLSTLVEESDIEIHLHSIGQSDKMQTHTWEPDKGTTSLQLEVRLNKKAPAKGVIVYIDTEDITAKEGEDYLSTKNSIYFAPGEDRVIVDYLIKGDVKGEGEEQFKVYLHTPQNAKLHKDHTNVTVTIKESILGSYTKQHDSYKRYADSWNEFVILYLTWKLDPKELLAYDTFEDYFVHALGKKPHNKYKQIVDNGIPITESDYVRNTTGTFTKQSHKSHHSHKSQHKEAEYLEPVVIFIDEGETEANLTILIQGDTLYEENEPFKVLMWTEHEDVTFIKSHGDMNTSKYTDLNLSTEVSLQSNETEIVVIILNDDEKPADNIAEFRFDCLDREKYKDFSIIGNDIRTPLLSEKRQNSNIMCNAVNASSLSGLRIKDHNAYHENNGTISFWMYDTSTIASSKTILNKGSFSVGTKTGSSNANKHLEITLGNGSTITSTSSYDPNSPTWIFVTLSYERNGQLKLYLNGKLDIQGNYDGSFQNEQDISLGAYEGYVDEFYLFDNSMTRDEIAYLYQQQLANINVDMTPRDCACSQSMPPLLAEYRYDVCFWYGQEGEVIDHSSYNNHLNTQGLIQPYPNGKIHNGPQFDANKTQILGSIEGSISNEITVSTWFKTKETQTLGVQTPLVELSESGTKNNNISLSYHTDGQTLIAWSSNENNEKSAVVQYNLEQNGFHDDTWHMATFTYNDGTSKLYVDGELKHTMTKDIGQLTEITKLTIGSSYDNSVVFKGALDETLLFGEALTASEIEAIYAYTNQNKSWDGNDRNTTICDYPNVSISNPTIKEGDSGISVMEFKIGLDTVPQVPTDLAYTLHEGTATLDDNDYQEPELTEKLTFSTTETEKTIRVNIVGDMKIEPSETLSLTVSSPLLTIPTNQDHGIGTIINDDAALFAIERADVESLNPPAAIDALTMAKKSALYTQVVNQDFDYSIVSYEKNTTGYLETVSGVEDLTLKIELKDVNSTNQEILYRAYFYIPSGSTNSRFRIDNLSNDLQISQATRHAKFEVTALLDQNGSIIHGDLTQNNDFDQTLASQNGIEQVGHSDLFAIRPLGYYFEIRDNEEHNNSLYAQNDQDNTVKLAAQHDYKLYLAAITNMDNNVSTQYRLLGNSELNASLSFDDKSTCRDTQDGELHYVNNSQSFQSEDLGSIIESSQLGNITLAHHNVGNYQLEIQDINWTYVDQHNDPDLTGCIIGSSSNIRQDNKYGCNFSSDIYGDFNIEYQAYEFNLSNTQLHNISQNGQSYLYMGDDLEENKQMGIELSTDILALGAKGIQLSNYTSSCVSKDVNINLSYLLTDQNTSSASNYQDFRTTEGTVQPLQMMKILNETNSSIIDTHFSNSINIPKTAFLDPNEGNSSLKLLYNIQKSTSETINPIHVNFLNLKADANETEHHVEGKQKTAEEKIGSGHINTERTFYFSRLEPDLKNYPATPHPSITTPLSVEIFCDVNRTWCSKMVPSDIGVNSLYSIYGWYISKTHQNTDGSYSLETGTIKINPDNGTSPLTVAGLQTAIDIDEDLSTTDGRFRDTSVNLLGGFANNDEATRSVSVEVRVTPDPWLRYNPNVTRGGNSSYNVTFKNPNFGTISGVGESGQILNIDANTKKTNKLSW